MYPIKTFSPEEQSNIKLYNFQSENSSFLSTFLVQKFFDFLHVYIPDSITPNQITWFGGACMLLSLCLTLYFNPTLKAKSPRLSLANFILMFLYFSADFMDGMHARRTNRCSPLGSILDHGIDSLVCTVVILGVSSTLRLGISTTLLFIAYNVYLGFYGVGLYLKYVGLFRHNLISGESRSLLLVMFLHILAFCSPMAIDGLKMFFGSKYFSSTFFNFFYILLSLFSTILVLADLFYNMVKHGKNIHSDVLTSISGMFILLISLCLLFNLFHNSKPLEFHLSLLVFSFSFTICYIEETISVLSKAPQEILSYLFSYAFIFISLITKSVDRSTMVYKAIFISSFLHFLLRIGSVLYNMATFLNISL